MKKNKIIIFLIILVLLIVPILLILINLKSKYKIEEIKEINFFTIMAGNKVGVINKKGDIIIEPIYEDIQIPNPSKPVFICVTEFDENKIKKSKTLNSQNEEILTEFDNISAIKLNGDNKEFPFEKSVLRYEESEKFGLIDFDGEQITKPIYDEIESVLLKEGELIVNKDGKLGIINIRGGKIIPIKYDYIDSDGNKENSGYIFGNVKNDKMLYGYMNNKGKIVTKNKYEKLIRITDMEDLGNIYLIATKDGKTGVLKNNKEHVKFDYEDIRYYYGIQVLELLKNNKKGIIDINKREIVPLEYEDIFFRGLFLVATNGDIEEVFSMLENKIETDNLIGIGKTKTNDIVVINKDKLYGIVDEELNIKIPIIYSNIKEIENNKFIVCNKEGKLGIIDLDNSNIIDVKYDIIEPIANTNIIEVVMLDSKKIILFTKELKKIISIENANMVINEKFIEVYNENLKKYIDFEGNILDNKQLFKNNKLFTSVKNNKWGFIDKEGNVKVEYIYDNITEFNDLGFAGIKVDDKWGVIDSECKIVIEPQYPIKEGNPYFIGKYYKLNSSGIIYYTDKGIK